METSEHTLIDNNLYDRDFNAWIGRQVTLLRTKRFDEIDLPNLVEEIEDMSKREKRSVRSALTIILMHLLKYCFQRSRRTNSWDFTIREHRRRLQRDLDESPSLLPYVQKIFAESYLDAREDAANETGLPLKTFPTSCPFNLDQVLDKYFLTDQENEQSPSRMR